MQIDVELGRVNTFYLRSWNGLGGVRNVSVQPCGLKADVLHVLFVVPVISTKLDWLHPSQAYGYKLFVFIQLRN